MEIKEILIVGELRNNRDGSIVKVRVVEFPDRGNRCLDLRKWVTGSDGGLKPTSTGIMMGSANSEWLLSLLEQSRDEIVEVLNPIDPVI